MSYKQKEYIIVGAGVLIFFVLIWAWSYIFLFLPFNYDAGYYLSCAERIYEGLKPYLDFEIHYPPVGIYYFVFFRHLLGGDPTSYRVALLLVEILSAFLFFLLSGSFIKSKALRLTGTLLFLLLYLSYDGGFFVLEYFVTIFTIASILFLQRDRKSRLFTFLAGIFFLLAIMSKQYAVITFPILVFLLVKPDDNHSIDYSAGAIRFVFFIAGFFLAFLAIVSFLGINIWDFIVQLKGTGYGKTGAVKMFVSLLSLRNIWFIFVFLLGFYMLWRNFQFGTFLLLSLFILNLIPTFVRGYAHYYQLPLPYALIFLIGIIEYYFLEGQGKKRNIFENVTIFLTGLTLSITILSAIHVPLYYSLSKESQNYLYEKLYSKYNFNRKTLSDTLKMAKKINEILPAGSRVAVINEPSYSFLCGFMPPEDKNGYRFIGRITTGEYDLGKIDNIVWFDGLFDYATFLRTVSENHVMVSSLSFSDKSRVEIWKRR
jgi:hypothetical protein